MHIAIDCHKITQYEVICPFLSLEELTRMLNYYRSVTRKDAL